MDSHRAIRRGGHGDGVVVTMRWTVIGPKKGLRILCRCSCGTERAVLEYDVRTGASQSCGCLQRERTGQAARTHGHSRNRVHSPTYRSWASMLSRCKNPRFPEWKRYGARGIVVCERWMKFENFLADMGERPAGKTLDRINNDGNYKPSNCRWATPTEQSRNTRHNHSITFNGRTMLLTEWARHLGINLSTLNSRINRYGWTVERALTVRPVT